MSRRDSIMLEVTITNLGEVSLVRCDGRIVAGDETTALRSAVMSQGSKKTLIIDLPEARAVDGGGLGLLVSLRGWARSRGIALKLIKKCRNCSNSRIWILFLTLAHPRTCGSNWSMQKPQSVTAGCPNFLKWAKKGSTSRRDERVRNSVR
jgi:hypothetical protein